MGDLGHIHHGDSSQGVAEKRVFLRDKSCRGADSEAYPPTVAMSRPQLDLQIRSGGPGAEYERATATRKRANLRRNLKRNPRTMLE